MSLYLKIVPTFFFIYSGILLGQSKHRPLSKAEQWEKDSIESLAKYKKKWTNDSIKWVKVYNERINPKDSLSYIYQKTKVLFLGKISTSLDSVLSIINSNFKLPIHKARAIYFWIATNIKYDSVNYLSKSIIFYGDLEKDAEYTFSRKTGVCSQYASLYQLMLQKCGIEAMTINGYSKISAYKYVSAATDHAWNVVKIKGKWILVDPTWGRLSNDEVETFWFNTPPETFIYSHFPQEGDCQLLKRPISISTFRIFPIVSTNFFLSKIPFTIPELGYFSNENGVLQIEAANTNKSYQLEFTVYPVSSDSSPQFLFNENWLKIPYLVKNSTKKGFSVIETKVPGKGSWWVKLDVTEKVKLNGRNYGISFPRSLIFQVTKM